MKKKTVVAATSLTAAGGAVLGTMAVAGGVAAAAYWTWRRRQGHFSLRGRVALVTGGTRGLGFAITRQLLNEGCRVAVCSRDAEECQRAAERLSARGEVFAQPCDLRQPEQITALVRAIEQHWGPVDILVNNAGIMQVGPWEHMEEDDLREALAIHVWAPLRLIQAVTPHMRAQKAGRIVNISSIGGIVPVPHMLPYTASKFALTGMSEALRAELARDGVKVTTICPWLTRTGSQEGAQFKGQHEKEFAWFAGLGTAPFVPQSAPAAARRTVRALRHGEGRVVLALPGKLAALAHGATPGATLALLALAARWLPNATPNGQTAHAGHESYNRLTAAVVRPRIQRDKKHYNQPAA